MRIGIPSARNLDPKLYSGRHVLGEAGVHTLNANIAERVEIIRLKVGVIACIRAFVEALPVWDLKHRTPTAIKHVLRPKGHKVGAQNLVIVVPRRGDMTRMPI